MRPACATVRVSLWLVLGATGAVRAGIPEDVEAALRPAHVADELLVRFAADAPSAVKESLAASLGAQSLRRFARGGEHWKLAAGSDLAVALAELRGSPLVRWAEPNYLGGVDRVPNDPRYPGLWGLHNTGQTGGTPGADIRAESAWNVTVGSPQVMVAVLDTGIDFAHPDLAANLWTNPGETAGNGVDDDGNGYVDDVHGWDFIYEDNDPEDSFGHGTHVAGTIAAVGDNGLGVTGVAWSVRLVGLKWIDWDGYGTAADAIEAIDYATAIGVDVMNASWWLPQSMELLDALHAASDAGILFVASAGNSAVDIDLYPQYPASYDLPNVIAVAATDATDSLAWFSNWGPQSVDLAAPGVGTLSCIPGGYGLKSGTSMAAPHVAGIAALIRSIAPDVTLATWRERLLASVDPVPELQGLVVTGGRANAFLAVADPDQAAPGAVTDLSVQEALSNGVVVQWTATGDDGQSGQATAYRVRYATTPFDQAGFDTARPASAPPVPLPAGSRQSFEITGLEPATTYYIAVRALDEWGNEGPMSALLQAQTLAAPTLASSPSSFELQLSTGERATRVLHLTNAGEGALDWRIPQPELAGPSGSLDALAYAWADSSQPEGPEFSWTDMQATGTSLWDHVDDVVSEAVPLGFTFPFYGTAFDAVHVSSDGWLSFTHTQPTFQNGALPGSGPEFLIAPLWDDLVVSTAPVVYLREPGRFTVQYTGVERYRGGGAYTFQVCLEESGTIEFRYLSVPAASSDSATVGIQDGSQTSGLEIAFNVPYVTSGLAVRIRPRPGWLSALPVSGLLRAGESTDVTLAVDAKGLLAGPHATMLFVDSNDPENAHLAHAVTLHVLGAPDLALEGPPIDLESSRDYIGSGATTVHALQTAVAPAGPGVLELVAQGDFGASFELARVFVEGVQVGAAGPAKADCQPALGTFLLSRDLLAAALVDGVVDVEVRNTVPVETFCTPNRHSLRLRYRGATELTFGERYLGTLATLSFDVINVGSLPLHVTSISIEAGPFQVTPAQLQLEPRTRARVTVTFDTATEGTHASRVLLESDDPDEPWIAVPVSGSAVRPPHLRLSPAAIEESLFAGEVRTRELTLANDGGAALSWSARVRVPPSTPGATVLLVRDVLPFDRQAIEIVLQSKGIAYDVVTAAQLAETELSPYAVVLVASDQTSSFYVSLAARRQQIDAFVASGGVLEFHACGWGWNEGDATPVVLPRGVSIVQAQETDNYLLLPGHPIVAGAPAALYGSLASHARLTHVPDDALRIAADTGGGLVLVEYRFGAGRVIAGTQTYEYYYGTGNPIGDLLENMVSYAHDLPVRWLSLLPISGTLLPAHAGTVQLRIDASGLDGGHPSLEVLLASNDPLAPQVVLPVQLHVTGAPALHVSAHAIDFGEVFLGVSATQTLTLTNTGSAPLVIPSLTTDRASFTVSPQTLTIAPHTSAELAVSFAAEVLGPQSAALAVESDGPDGPMATVALLAHAVVGPDIAVHPEEVGVDLLPGEATDRGIAVENLGERDLVFQIRPEAIVSMREDFEDGDAAGWSVEDGNPEVQVVADTGAGGTAHSLRVRSDDFVGGHYRGLYRPLGGMHPRFIRFHLRMGRRDQTAGDFVLTGPSGHAAIFLYATRTGYFNVNGYDESVPYFPLRWYRIEFRDIDWEGKTFDYWVDGVLVVPGVPFVAPQFNPSASHLHLYNFAAGAQAWWDEILLTESASPPWLNVSPQSGTVSPGGRLDLTLHFDATGSLAGDYQQSVHIDSNDADEPDRGIAVSMLVTDLRASAGPDQIVECTGDLGAAVTLDGTASEHVGGPAAITSWRWREGAASLGEAPILSVPLGLGSHAIELVIADAQRHEARDQVQVEVRDTLPPGGHVTSPLAGACYGPSSLPLLAQDDFVDLCGGGLSRTWGPEGNTFVTHGDHVVDLTVTDGRGLAAPAEAVAFTIDTRAPSLALAHPEEDWTHADLAPFRLSLAADDDDAASGGVQREWVTLQDCPLWDGTQVGDGDGLLSDESLDLTPALLCAAAARCGWSVLAQPRLTVRAVDCAGNEAQAMHPFSATVHLVGLCGSLDGGRVVLRHPDKEVLRWDPVPEARSYAVYRGSLDDLRDADGDGLPDQGYGPCASGEDPDPTDTKFVDRVPAPGAGWYYLVAYRNEQGERGLGTTSAGLARTPEPRCP